MRRLVVVLLAAAIPLCAAAPAASAARPGQLDKRYARNGIFETKRLDGGWAARRDRGGTLLVAGGVNRQGVARLTRRGRLVRRFGRRGIARARTRLRGLPFGIRRLGGGTIRVGTTALREYTAPVELLRLGRRGRRLAPLLHDTAFLGPISAAVLRPDGGAYVMSAREIRAIAADGSVDERFAGGTLAASALPGVEFFDGSMVLRPGGRLLLSAESLGRRRLLVQLLPDGTPDPTFGTGGVVRVPFRPSALHIARSGDVIAAAGRGRYLARVYRLSPAGARRRAFGVGGLAGWHRARWGGSVEDIAEDGRGRIYVLTEAYDSHRLSVLALTRGGRRIGRFGRRGLARLPRPKRAYSALEGNELLVDRGGLLVVGSFHVDGYYHAAFSDGGSRDDASAYETRLRVWRLRR